LESVAHGSRTVVLAPSARAAVERSRRIVDEAVARGAVVYGVTTGFGNFADVVIPKDKLRELQLNLVRSHAAGVGELLDEADTRALMLLRANVLAKGFSGVRPETLALLLQMINRRVHPLVPSQGSVGASGDLAPLAHLALGLVGEGNCSHEGRPQTASTALAAAGLAPVVLEAKEGLALINGTQLMTAVGGLALLEAGRLARAADIVGALTLDVLKGTDVAFDPRIHAARPHPGQAASARNLTKVLAGSAIRESHRDCGKVQDAYSLRCIPQVHGAVRDTLAHCRRVFEIEMNSAVDNPLVFPAAKKIGGPKPAMGAPVAGDVISGGNFHGEPVAFALDFLAIALSALAGISERRLERLVNPSLNEDLPPFLAAGAGLNSGFMMPQVTAAALVSENKVWSHPASVDSITTSGNKEDFVSMGMTAANKLQRVVENTRNVLAIEALAVAQALDFRVPLKTSKRGQAAHKAIRAVSPTVAQDRVLTEDFRRVAELISSGELADVLRG
jgi:histidine ammonia-lyase